MCSKRQGYLVRGYIRKTIDHQQKRGSGEKQGGLAERYVMGCADVPDTDLTQTPRPSWNAYLAPVYHVLHRSPSGRVCHIHRYSRLQKEC